MSRITPGTVIVGIFAVLFGLVGAFGVRKYFQSDKAGPPPPQQPARQVIPLASSDLEGGRHILFGDVAILRIPQGDVDRMVKDGKLPKQFMTNPQQIIGRVLKTPLKQGEAFQTDGLYAEGSGPTIAEKLSPGLRAVTIHVEGTGALGGYDGPGSYVDVVFRARPDDKAGIPETTVTLLEGVQVLSMEEADKRAPPGAKLSNRVTLAVTSAQANALKIAEGRGTFTLSLRNPEDVDVAASNDPQTLDRLLNVPAREQFTTSIYRGGASSAVSFPGAMANQQRGVQLPVAGVLQMRAAQQATSLEVEGSAKTDEPTVEAPVAEPAVKGSAPARAAAPSARTQTVAPPPAYKATGAGKKTVEPQASNADDLATVTVQIPVSVLLADKKAASAVGKVPDSSSPAIPYTGAAVQPETESPPSGVSSVSETRSRKMLSDIGRRTGKQAPAKRTRS